MKAGLIIACLASLTLTGCNSVSNALNPFYDPPSPVALKGERNDAALYNNGGSGTAENSARQALDSLAHYQGAHYASANKPVMNPAVVRLVWIPDHLNSHGDMVPAHYYYLKVKDDQWALQDAFEIDAQLGRSGGGTASSTLPFYQGEDLKK